MLLLELLWLQKRINPLQVSKPTLVESGSSLVSAEELVLLLLEFLSLQKRINPMLELLPPSRRREMVVLPLPQLFTMLTNHFSFFSFFLHFSISLYCIVLYNFPFRLLFDCMEWGRDEQTSAEDAFIDINKQINKNNILTNILF